jgi:DnaJ-class molecular chaperone
MCEEIIEGLKKEFNLPIKVCPDCLGDGKITTFCGHDITEYCQKCSGKGYIKYSTVSKHKQRKLKIFLKRKKHYVK